MLLCCECRCQKLQGNLKNLNPGKRQHEKHKFRVLSLPQGHHRLEKAPCREMLQAEKWKAQLLARNAR